MPVHATYIIDRLLERFSSMPLDDHAHSAQAYRVLVLMIVFTSFNESPQQQLNSNLKGPGPSLAEVMCPIRQLAY